MLIPAKEQEREGSEQPPPPSTLLPPHPRPQGLGEKGRWATLCGGVLAVGIVPNPGTCPQTSELLGLCGCHSELPVQCSGTPNSGLVQEGGPLAAPPACKTSFSSCVLHMGQPGELATGHGDPASDFPQLQDRTVGVPGGWEEESGRADRA